MIHSELKFVFNMLIHVLEIEFACIIYIMFTMLPCKCMCMCIQKKNPFCCRTVSDFHFCELSNSFKPVLYLKKYSYRKML